MYMYRSKTIYLYNFPLRKQFQFKVNLKYPLYVRHVLRVHMYLYVCVCVCVCV